MNPTIEKINRKGDNMKKALSVCLGGALALALTVGVTACGDSSGGSADVSGKKIKGADLSVSTGTIENATKISDDLFGIFLEDINYASYAMDDNLLRNGNFDSLTDTNAQTNPMLGWRGIDAELVAKDFDGIFEQHAEYNNEALKRYVNPNNMEVNVSKANGGLSNSGYEPVPMAVTAGEKLNFSAFINSTMPAQVTVSVTDGTKTYATGSFTLDSGGEWIKYKTTLTATETGTSNLRFEMRFSEQGTYYVDAVALETQNSTIGIKNYIYNAIKDLSPKFMRFPGGCIIEGDATNGKEDCVEVYDWKNSIGAGKGAQRAHGYI